MLFRQCAWEPVNLSHSEFVTMVTDRVKVTVRA